MRSPDLVAFVAPITAGFVAPCKATRIGAANNQIALDLCHWSHSASWSRALNSRRSTP